MQQVYKRSFMITLVTLVTLFYVCIAYGQDAFPGFKKAVDDYNSGKYPEAEKEFTLLLPVIEEKLATHVKIYIDLVSDLSNIYQSTGKTGAANSLVKQALATVRIQMGENNLIYAFFLNLLGTIDNESGDYKEAENSLKQALDIFRNMHWEHHKDYLLYSANLAITYEKMGQYDKAESLMVNVLSIGSQVLNPRDINYAKHMSHLAAIYNYTGRFKDADTLINRALKIVKNEVGEKTFIYADMLCNLGITHMRMGNYWKAEELYLKAIRIAGETIGEDDPDYGDFLIWLSRLYQEMGRYKEAEPLVRQSISIILNRFGEKYRYYSSRLNSLAEVYANMGNSEEAEALLIKSCENDRINLGEDAGDYARDLYCLSLLYVKLGRYDEAEQLIGRSMEIDENNNCENYPVYANKLITLGLIYYKTEWYLEAEASYMEALKIARRTLGENHLKIAQIYNYLAQLYLDIADYQQAEAYVRQAFRVYLYQIKMNAVFLSEKELEQFFSTFLYQLDLYQSFIYDLMKHNMACSDFAYDIELKRKSILLYSILEVKNNILKSSDTSIISTYNYLLCIRNLLDNNAFSDSSGDEEYRQFAEQQANKAEKVLSLESSKYNLKREDELSWKEVQKNLKDNEAAIEFVRFHYYHKSDPTNTFLYCAVVLKKDDALPHLVYLCDEKRLKNAVPPVGSSCQKINPAYLDEKTSSDSAGNRNHLLYNLIWKPCESLLKGINTIFFAPSGLLNSVSMNAICCPDRKILMEKYNMVQLRSTRNLAMDERKEIIKNAVVYGGIQYNSDTSTMLRQTQKYRRKENSLRTDKQSPARMNNKGFKFLPGTESEAKLIADNFRRKGIQTTLYSGTEASEESFNALSGMNSPSVIHLSTHGFYYPATIKDMTRKQFSFSLTGENKFIYSDDPLLRSGVVLSGANLAFKGNPLPQDLEDGILTAKEVSNLYLINTELVVLSACQSAQGDVRGNEGVEGLQRGFKLAGVGKIIMSLWEIPDKETQEFMVSFYDCWLNGRSIHEAFRMTQLKMKTRYPNEPYKWAAFILLE